MKKVSDAAIVITGLITIIITLTVLIGMQGCEDSQAEPAIWGQGHPDPNHIKYFGNSNLSRLCFVQTNTINRQAKLINELVALNAKQHKILGESDIRLFNRVRKLEDPNEPRKNKTADKQQ